MKTIELTNRPHPQELREIKTKPATEKGDVRRKPKQALMKLACDNCSFLDFTPVCTGKCVPARKDPSI